jgi:hypothetical protein
MGKRAKDGPNFQALVKLALPSLKEAERRCPRKGPGAKPIIPDWTIAALIMIAVLARRKSKSAQYRFLQGKQLDIARWLGVTPFRFPARSTYFSRYRRAYRLYQEAVRLQGLQAVEEGVTDPTHVAVDKSLIAAKGPPWHQRDRRAGKTPPGVDQGGAWGYSEHDGWTYGYSYEVVVTSTPKTTVFPLLASAATGSACETQTCPDKAKQLPANTKSMSGDAGYDANHLGELVEYDAHDRRTGRRFLCPENPRNAGRPKTKPCGADASRAKSRQRRAERRKYFESPKGRRLYSRRKKTVEPFNQWFKAMFELDHRVWHRGLENNRTQFLAAIFGYQLLARYNYRRGNRNGQLQWILDAL